MNRHVRGSTINFTVNNLLTSAGVAATPTTISVYLDYPATLRTRAQTSVSLTNASGTWTGSWDSEVAFHGTVFVSVKAEGTDDFALDDQFQLTANQSNQTNLDPTS